MKYSRIIFIIALFISSCSKQEACFCNEGNGEYEYLPPSTNAQSSGTVNASGELDEECELQSNYLKAINSNSYCKLD
jgi:hypothetical protein